jgi:hypothetical protein
LETIFPPWYIYPNKQLPMAEESELEKREQLKAENNFLKMKLMLEKGAQFGVDDQVGELHPELENKFLKNIIEFEKQFEQQKTIKVFDKIGRPTHFLPVDKIPDNKIEQAWKSLLAYLNKYRIGLGVCSPNIPVRELYRFTTQELFNHQMEDVDVPEIMHGFIYDEFYPDIVYDNERVATDDCIHYILRKEPIEWTHHFKSDNLRLNEHYPIGIEELKVIINRFKAAYDDIELKEIKDIHCSVSEKDSRVNGKYLLTVSTGVESYQLSGDWKVEFELDDELGYWYITEIQIENIRF